MKGVDAQGAAATASFEAANAAMVLPLSTAAWLLRIDEFETRPGNCVAHAIAAPAAIAARSQRGAPVDAEWQTARALPPHTNASTGTAVSSHIQSTPACTRNRQNAVAPADTVPISAGS